MARKKDTPQKVALREMMGNYIKENNVKVKDGTDAVSYTHLVFKLIQDLMAPSPVKNRSLFQLLMDKLPPNHKADVYKRQV